MDSKRSTTSKRQGKKRDKSDSIVVAVNMAMVALPLVAFTWSVTWITIVLLSTVFDRSKSFGNNRLNHLLLLTSFYALYVYGLKVLFIVIMAN